MSARRSARASKPTSKTGFVETPDFGNNESEASGDDRSPSPPKTSHKSGTRASAKKPKADKSSKRHKGSKKRPLDQVEGIQPPEDEQYFNYPADGAHVFEIDDDGFPCTWVKRTSRPRSSDGTQVPMDIDDDGPSPPSKKTKSSAKGSASGRRASRKTKASRKHGVVESSDSDTDGGNGATFFRQDASVAPESAGSPGTNAGAEVPVSSIFDAEDEEESGTLPMTRPTRSATRRAPVGKSDGSMLEPSDSEWDSEHSEPADLDLSDELDFVPDDAIAGSDVDWSEASDDDEWEEDDPEEDGIGSNEGLEPEEIDAWNERLRYAVEHIASVARSYTGEQYKALGDLSRPMRWNFYVFLGKTPIESLFKKADDAFLPEFKKLMAQDVLWRDSFRALPKISGKDSGRKGVYINVMTNNEIAKTEFKYRLYVGSSTDMRRRWHDHQKEVDRCFEKIARGEVPNPPGIHYDEWLIDGAKKDFRRIAVLPRKAADGWKLWVECLAMVLLKTIVPSKSCAWTTKAAQKTVFDARHPDLPDLPQGLNKAVPISQSFKNWGAQTPSACVNCQKPTIPYNRGGRRFLADVDDPLCGAYWCSNCHVTKLKTNKLPKPTAARARWLGKKLRKECQDSGASYECGECGLSEHSPKNRYTVHELSNDKLVCGRCWTKLQRKLKEEQTGQRYFQGLRILDDGECHSCAAVPGTIYDYTIVSHKGKQTCVRCWRRAVIQKSPMYTEDERSIWERQQDCQRELEEAIQLGVPYFCPNSSCDRDLVIYTTRGYDPATGAMMCKPCQWKASKNAKKEAAKTANPPNTAETVVSPEEAAETAGKNEVFEARRKQCKQDFEDAKEQKRPYPCPWIKLRSGELCGKDLTKECKVRFNSLTGEMLCESCVDSAHRAARKAEAAAAAAAAEAAGVVDPADATDVSNLDDKEIEKRRCRKALKDAKRRGVTYPCPGIKNGKRCNLDLTTVTKKPRNDGVTGTLTCDPCMQRARNLRVKAEEKAKAAAQATEGSTSGEEEN